MTEFFYDDAGRVSARDEAIDGRTYTRRFVYDGNDNLTGVVYPSGRQVTFAYGAENRMSRVTDTTAGRDVATDFSYHPSGAVTSYQSGNGIVNQIDYDPQRYWPRHIGAGALQLSYDNYDGVGNVGAIGDPRPGMGQTFVYDVLDRLESATGQGISRALRRST